VKVLTMREERYIRNGTCVMEKEQERLAQCKIVVIGCGGLGGYIIEMLARIGIGSLRVVDGDVFSTSNWNRQLLSEEGNLGENKALEAKKRVERINKKIQVEALTHFMEADQIESILEGCDLVLDGLDNLSTRKMLLQKCKELQLPYVYGAIAGWYGQIALILPDCPWSDVLFGGKQEKGEEEKVGNPSFTPAIVAGIQVSEAIKYLLGKVEEKHNYFLQLDLLSNELEKIIFEKP